MKIINIINKKLFIIALNIFILILNVKFLFRNDISQLQIIKIETKFSFLEKLKKVDIFIYALLLHSYHKIENYFINKFKIGVSEIISKYNFKKAKIIKYYGVNLNDERTFQQNITSYIKKKYKLKFDKDKPDYLFFNVFGDEELNHKYNNCIKIAYFTENSIPDFSQCDYAIGHPHINYMDRYFKFLVSYIWALKSINYIKLFEIRNKTLFNPRKKFCAAVISDVSAHCNDFFRLHFINELNIINIDINSKLNII